MSSIWNFHIQELFIVSCAFNSCVLWRCLNWRLLSQSPPLPEKSPLFLLSPHLVLCLRRECVSCVLDCVATLRQIWKQRKFGKSGLICTKQQKNTLLLFNYKKISAEKNKWNLEKIEIIPELKWKQKIHDFLIFIYMIKKGQKTQII